MTALLSPEELFRKTKAGILPATLLFQGEDLYLAREFKKILAPAGFEVVEADLKKTGPDGATEDLCLGGSLFSAKTFLWLKKTTPVSQWTAGAKNYWKRMVSRADADALVIAIAVPLDKRMNWTPLGVAAQVPFWVDHKQRELWLKRMNAERQNFLDAARLHFLQGFEEELLVIDNWIELWSLGGDLWAEKSLGWRAGALISPKRPVITGNPAFAWVDAVLKADKQTALQILRELEEGGQEPLQLLALLSKSVRILAQLEAGREARGQPEFLVNKLRAQSRQGPRARGTQLLQACAWMDRTLKSSALDGFSLLANL